MICLSKNKKDEYVNRFAQGANLPIKDYGEGYEYSLEPVLIRGLGKRKIIQYRIEKGLPFYYMDSGYFGNYPSKNNPRGFKVYHRIVKNDLQHTWIMEYPDDRLKKLDIKIDDIRFKKQGYILLVTPSEKPCKFYGISRNEWIESTINKIRFYTDREIKIREKSSRKERVQNTVFQDLENANVMVTYQSIAAVESIISGVPAITLAPTAADPVCEKDISNIESPRVKSRQTIYKWASGLCYGQFHNKELDSGEAYRLLE